MSALYCATSGEDAPKTFWRSGLTFSSTMLAVETAPKSQPARVNGTHGAGGVAGGEPAAGTFAEYGWFGNESSPYVPVQ